MRLSLFPLELPLPFRSSNTRSYSTLQIRCGQPLLYFLPGWILFTKFFMKFAATLTQHKALSLDFRACQIVCHIIRQIIRQDCLTGNGPTLYSVDTTAR